MHREAYCWIIIPNTLIMVRFKIKNIKHYITVIHVNSANMKSPLMCVYFVLYAFLYVLNVLQNSSHTRKCKSHECMCIDCRFERKIYLNNNIWGRSHNTNYIVCILNFCYRYPPKYYSEAIIDLVLGLTFIHSKYEEKKLQEVDRFTCYMNKLII